MTLDYLSNIERQQEILIFLNRQQRISVAEICEMFAVSEATARRDLEVLTEQNHLRRVHGGAISLRQAPPELPMLQREMEQAEEKKKIGLAAAHQVQDGETVFLGSGSTVLEAARILKDRSSLTVITNSLPVMNLLSGLSDISLIALGGMLRDSELSFIGHITEQALSEIRADKVIIGIHAIDLENGLTNDYLPETMTDRAILKCGREVIVVADHTKINSVSIAYLAPVESIHKFITDQNAPANFLSSLAEKGIIVITA
ncbi:MAG: DeoR family transcriptional regulator [Chloroflexi bacterium 44-23]|nr:MAG: DeoR family transcriptional regulator [Chloroflexi bacterium 44-23]